MAQHTKRGKVGIAVKYIAHYGIKMVTRIFVYYAVACAL